MGVSWSDQGKSLSNGEGLSYRGEMEDGRVTLMEPRLCRRDQAWALRRGRKEKVQVTWEDFQQEVKGVLS